MRKPSDCGESFSFFFFVELWRPVWWEKKKRKKKTREQQRCRWKTISESGPCSELTGLSISLSQHTYVPSVAKKPTAKKPKRTLQGTNQAVHSPPRRSAPRIEGINSPDFPRQVGCVPHIPNYVSTGGDTIQWERDLANAGEFQLHVSRQMLIKVSCRPIKRMGGMRWLSDLRWEWCLWISG